MLKHMTELGLTPSSRVRLAAGKGGDTDKLGDFLANKRTKKRQA